MSITKNEFLNITNKNKVNLNFGSAFSSLKSKDVILLPISKPRFSAKYNLHKLTLKNQDNPNGCKYYAYLRGEKVTFAFGDMPIMVKKIEIL